MTPPPALTKQKIDYKHMTQTICVQLRCYTDDGCDHNDAGGVWGASGWGVHVMGVSGVPPPPCRNREWTQHRTKVGYFMGYLAAAIIGKTNFGRKAAKFGRAQNQRPKIRHGVEPSCAL
jgi:hypothetical protein